MKRRADRNPATRLLPMLGELRRRRRLGSGRAGGSRWARWALSLIGSHGRRDIRGGLDLALRRLLGPVDRVHMVRERERFVISSPKIVVNLMLQTVRPPNPPSPLTARVFALRAALPLAAGAGRREVVPAIDRADVRQPAWPQERADMFPVMETPESPNGPLWPILSPANPTPARSLGPAPFQQVRRLSARSSRAGLTSLQALFGPLAKGLPERAREGPAIEASRADARAPVQEFVDRITRQGRRFESLVEPTATLARRAEAGMTRSDAARSMERSELDRETTFQGKHWTQRATQRAEAGMDVDQITEHVMRQIDQRVIAMRERMGKF